MKWFTTSCLPRLSVGAGDGYSWLRHEGWFRMERLQNGRLIKKNVTIACSLTTNQMMRPVLKELHHSVKSISSFHSPQIFYQKFGYHLGILVLFAFKISFAWILHFNMWMSGIYLYAWSLRLSWSILTQAGNQTRDSHNIVLSCTSNRVSSDLKNGKFPRISF